MLSMVLDNILYVSSSNHRIVHQTALSHNGLPCCSKGVLILSLSLVKHEDIDEYSPGATNYSLFLSFMANLFVLKPCHQAHCVAHHKLPKLIIERCSNKLSILPNCSCQ